MTPSAAPPETVPPPMARGIARIALVAFSSLGDGLLYLMMAHNLALKDTTSRISGRLHISSATGYRR